VRPERGAEVAVQGASDEPQELHGQRVVEPEPLPFGVDGGPGRVGTERSPGRVTG